MAKNCARLAVDGVVGPFTFSVWQNTDLRDGFVRSRTRPVFLIIASMIGALAVIVWFGVRLGLYPLIDLENAIAQRSASDLSPIRRPIPVEVSDIVGRLNSLLAELKRTLEAKDVFISDAAHQLRNPIAGVLALAESVKAAKTPEVLQLRSDDLIEAAQETALLANDLLTLERAHAVPREDALTRFDATALIEDVANKFGKTAEGAGVSFQCDIPNPVVTLFGDPVLFEQALLNMLTNALTHGGPTLSEITLSARVRAKTLIIIVGDNGKGIPIAQAIAETFDGKIELKSGQDTFAVELHFTIAT